MNNRQGVGLFFIIIVTLIVIVAFVGIFQMSFARHVVDQVGDVAIGETALLLAESAVAEAAFNVRKKVNNPADDAFKIFRQEVYGHSTGCFPIEIKIPHTRKLLQKKQYQRFSLDDLDVTVLFQKQFSNAPYEKYGLINCSATVSKRTGLASKITRTVNLSLEFKVQLTAPPRPFDQVTFLVVNAAPVVNSANNKIEDTIAENERLARERDEFVTLLENERGTIPGFNFDNAIDLLNNVNIPSKATIEQRVHEFHTPLTIFTVKENVTLEMVDLPGRLKEAERSIREAQSAYENARSDLNSNSTSQQAVSAYVTALKNVVAAYDQNVAAVSNFQTYFAEYYGQARAQLSPFFPKLNESEWRTKAGWYITDTHGDVSAQLKELLTQISPLSGVVFVENPSQPLTLEGLGTMARGNLVIVTTGNVRLSDNGTTPSSLLTVVSYGTVSIEGTCHASVIVNNRLSMAPSARIKGNLIMRDIIDFSGIKGTITRNRKLHSGRTVPGDPSGAFIDYYFVSVSPCNTFQIIERK